jgi:hypothetical protein
MPDAPTQALEMVRASQVQQVSDARVFAVGPIENRRLVIYSETMGARCDCPELGICPCILAVILALQPSAPSDSSTLYGIDGGGV